jgi:hypothetical protein
MTLDALCPRAAPLLFAARSQCRQHLTFAILKLMVGALSKGIQVERLYFLSLAVNFPRSRRFDAIRVLYALETSLEPADGLRKQFRFAALVSLRASECCRLTRSVHFRCSFLTRSILDFKSDGDRSSTTVENCRQPVPIQTLSIVHALRWVE